MPNPRWRPDTKMSKYACTAGSLQAIPGMILKVQGRRDEAWESVPRWELIGTQVNNCTFILYECKLLCYCWYIVRVPCALGEREDFRERKSNVRFKLFLKRRYGLGVLSNLWCAMFVFFILQCPVKYCSAVVSGLTFLRPKFSMQTSLIDANFWQARAIVWALSTATIARGE